MCALVRNDSGSRKSTNVAEVTEMSEESKKVPKEVGLGGGAERHTADT